MSYPAYPEYKDCGGVFLGQVPSSWSISPLKHNCAILPSNIDKHTDPAETAVRLCNYTDVYYQDRIVDSLELMKASASRDQIAKFTLQAEDVVITKDSESADEIAIPSFVPKSLSDVVCGYHLAIIRPSQAVDGPFLRYLLMAKPLRAYFEVSARGLTRVGLSQFALGGVKVAWPPKAEQTQIARFLDHQTARIDALIAEQQRLIELLKEKRQAVISHAVTKGLDPDVAMKDSGVEWLGEVPEHWKIGKIKWYLSTTSGGTPPSENQEDFYGGDIPWLRTLDLNNDRVTTWEISVTHKAIAETSCGIVPERSVLIAMYGGDGTIGKNGLLTFNSAINQAICAFLPKKEISERYLHNYMRFIRPYWMIGAESSRKDPNIGQERIRDQNILVPPLSEQLAIADFLDSQVEFYEGLNQRAESLVQTLHERRNALLSAVVTGKIDVRDWEPPTYETFPQSTAKAEAPA